MKLGKLMIFVSNIAEAKRFYGEVLEFTVTSESESRLDFDIDGVELAAFKCEKDAAFEEYSNVARSVFVFEVESVSAKMSELRRKGVEFLHNVPAENDFSRYAAFADPFGNVHEVFERKAAPDV